MKSTGASTESLRRLLRVFAARSYSAANPGPVGEEAMSTVVDLFSMDYDVTWVDNNGGELCELYPEKLILVDREKNRPLPHSGQTTPKSIQRWNVDQLRSQIMVARQVRARNRFPFPFLFVPNENGKLGCVCRSSTIREDNPELRTADVGLLESFNVKNIFNLMFEARKVRPESYATTIETLDDTGAYENFNLASIPYGDIVFFTGYQPRNYEARGWKFDWEREDVIVKPTLPWAEKRLLDYEDWDIIRLAKEYLNVIKGSMAGGANEAGALVHCVSGWDRTPLFCALIRILLWAEGRVHKSLSPVEMVYLSVAYDWYLFGHQLNDRLVNRKSEIMRFCYDFLRYYAEDVQADDCQYGIDCEKLKEVSTLFLSAYSASIQSMELEL